jgi:peroxiredoxin
MSALVGQVGPDFKLKSALDKETSLADFKGQTIVVVFYPLDFSPLCSIQLIGSHCNRLTTLLSHD